MDGFGFDELFVFGSNPFEKGTPQEGLPNQRSSSLSMPFEFSPPMKSLQCNSGSGALPPPAKKVRTLQFDQGQAPLQPFTMKSEMQPDAPPDSPIRKKRVPPRTVQKEDTSEADAAMTGELSRLIQLGFSSASACTYCPREVLSTNKTLLSLHDCCSCDKDFASFSHSPSRILCPDKKKGSISIMLDDVEYTLRYRTLTTSSFVKAKTQKYCEKNKVLGVLSSVFYCNPGLPSNGDIANARSKLIAIKIELHNKSGGGADLALMYRISASRDTRGLALIKDKTYTVSIVYEGELGSLLLNNVSVGSEEAKHPTDFYMSSPDHPSEGDRSPVGMVNEGEVVNPMDLNPHGCNVQASQSWLSQHGFPDEVLDTLKDYTDGDLCALSKEDAKDLISPKYGIRLFNLVARQMASQGFSLPLAGQHDIQTRTERTDSGGSGGSLGTGRSLETYALSRQASPVLIDADTNAPPTPNIANYFNTTDTANGNSPFLAEDEDIDDTSHTNTEGTFDRTPPRTLNTSSDRTTFPEELNPDAPLRLTEHPPNRFELHGPVDADLEGQTIDIFVGGGNSSFTAADLTCLVFTPQHLGGPNILLSPSDFRPLNPENEGFRSGSISPVGLNGSMRGSNREPGSGDVCVNVPLAHSVWRLIAKRLNLENSFPVKMIAQFRGGNAEVVEQEVGIVIYQFRLTFSSETPTKIPANADEFWYYLDGLIRFFGHSSLGQAGRGDKSGNQFSQGGSGPGGFTCQGASLEAFLDLVRWYSKFKPFRDFLTAVCLERCDLEGEAANPMNEVDSYGFTLLHYVAFLNHEELVEMCLAAGADPTIRDNTFNMVPLQFVANLHPRSSVPSMLRQVAAKQEAEEEEEESEWTEIEVSSEDEEAQVGAQTQQSSSLPSSAPSPQSEQADVAVAITADRESFQPRLQSSKPQQQLSSIASAFKVIGLALAVSCFPLLVLLISAIPGDNQTAVTYGTLPLLTAFSSMVAVPLFNTYKGNANGSRHSEFLLNQIVNFGLTVAVFAVAANGNVLPSTVAIIAPLVVTALASPCSMYCTNTQWTRANATKFWRFALVWAGLVSVSFLLMMLLSAYVHATASMQLFITVLHQGAYLFTKGTLSFLAATPASKVGIGFVLRAVFNTFTLAQFTFSTNYLVLAVAVAAQLGRFASGHLSASKVEALLLQGQGNPMQLHFCTVLNGSEILADLLVTVMFMWLFPGLHKLLPSNGYDLISVVAQSPTFDAGSMSMAIGIAVILALEQMVLVAGLCALWVKRYAVAIHKSSAGLIGAPKADTSSAKTVQDEQERAPLPVVEEQLIPENSSSIGVAIKGGAPLPSLQHFIPNLARGNAGLAATTVAASAGLLVASMIPQGNAFSALFV
mmetsp:Transcript_37265/g.73246  ORF Transcript_37265/g.73246 Transcript_37265/m.73246 type:complete len:1369 (-) Transcript_37265:274-4380(-)|eukprot:CAMPEP_0175088122 /NCGR_PEP_ID=MMETSP0086_2-20121207/84_1 /TAXON_ID=136419 /ORGANISM="Unknown Unknown, Strain D1" /LENGTH=1368 /DNA_ID=CAMNT_0016360543 /DNA_START=120 /DNA_END=4226 /DNA_ORIENTATION=+